MIFFSSVRKEPKNKKVIIIVVIIINIIIIIHYKFEHNKQKVDASKPFAWRQFD